MNFWKSNFWKTCSPFTIKYNCKNTFITTIPPLAKYRTKKHATLNQIKLPNCCVNSNHETFWSLQRNLSIVKRKVTKLLKKTSNLLKTGIQLFRATLGKSMSIFTDNQRYTKYFIHFKCYDQWSLASVPAHAICQYMSRSNV